MLCRCTYKDQRGQTELDAAEEVFYIFETSKEEKNIHNYTIQLWVTLMVIY